MKKLWLLLGVLFYLLSGVAVHAESPLEVEIDLKADNGDIVYLVDQSTLNTVESKKADKNGNIEYVLEYNEPNTYKYFIQDGSRKVNIVVDVLNGEDGTLTYSLSAEENGKKLDSIDFRTERREPVNVRSRVSTNAGRENIAPYVFLLLISLGLVTSMVLHNKTKEVK